MDPDVLFKCVYSDFGPMFVERFLVVGCGFAGICAVLAVRLNQNRPGNSSARFQVEFIETAATQEKLKFRRVRSFPSFVIARQEQRI